MMVKVVTAKKIIQAQRLCVADVPGTGACQKCYLYSQRNTEGLLADGQPCYHRLAGDTIALIQTQEDFENSQTKLLLIETEHLKEKICVLERESKAQKAEGKVVHCTNCEYMHLNKDTGIRFCRLSQGLDFDLRDNDFCSRAKRRES